MTNVVSLRPRPRRLQLLPGGTATPGIPDFVQNELQAGFYRAFPKTLRIPDAPEPTSLCYTAQRFGMLEPENGVTAKRLTGWIEVKGEPVGMIQMDEWTPLPGITDSGFFEACDGWSQGTADFGHAALARWKVSRLAEIGPLVELSRVWIQPEHAHRRLWAIVVKVLLRQRYANSFSLLLLNTWAADYKAESIDIDAWRGRERWDRRRTSLGRLAQAALGVKSLPVGGELDDRWWYWKALSANVPPPRIRKVRW